jgi:hypothetical protein
MRIRMTAVAAVGATAMLAIASLSAVAQSEADPCTGTLEFGEEGMTWDATDPRLRGEGR